MNKKKIVLNLDEKTFQYLEVLAFGLNLERHDGNQDNKELLNGHNKQNDDFAPLVSRMIEDIAVSLADVKAIRASLNVSQNEFAQTLGTSVDTIKSWESKRRNPTGLAAKVLATIKDKPTLYDELAAH